MQTKSFGMDVSKAKLDCVLLLPDGKFRCKVVANNPNGFAVLTEWLKKYSESQAHVCMEATGIYWESIALHLANDGMMGSVVNPAQIKAYSNSKQKQR